MPPPGWEKKENKNGAVTYYNPQNANNQIAIRHSGPPVHFKVQGPRAYFEYKGPDGSFTTDKALDIALVVGLGRK
jgi:hypothetical protein